MAMGASGSCARRGSSGAIKRPDLAHGQSFSLIHRLACALEGLLRRAGGIDAGPVERTQIVGLLLAGDCGIRIGGVAAARGQSCETGVQIGIEEKAVEGYAKDVSG